MRELRHAGLRGLAFESFGDGVRAVVTGRAEDGSGNVSLSGGRDRAAALAARRAWSEHLGVHAEDWVVGGQVHGARVREVGEAQRGRGARDPAKVLPETDALVTALRGLPLYVAVADCAPVLLHLEDPSSPRLAVVHAGWRGLRAGVVEAALERLCAADGARPRARVRAGVGPCAGLPSYEVGGEVAALAPPAARRRLARRWTVDVGAWAAAALREAGVPAARIERAGIDSIADERCFSHRRQGPAAGRMGLIAALAR